MIRALTTWRLSNGPRLIFISPLTSKGLNVHTANKPVLGSVTGSQFFLNFLKFFVNMHLVISFIGVQISYFLDLRIKSYGCLKILEEVWVGQACARANQQELTTCVKICGQEEKGNFWQGLV
jgi:hypothetical protein